MNPAPTTSPTRRRTRLAARRPAPIASRGQRGVALILTLIFLAIVIVLVLGFSISMRFDHMAARSYNDLVRARQLGEAAVAHAQALIRQATPDLGVTGAWVAAPGLIFHVSDGAITTNKLYSEHTVMANGSNWRWDPDTNDLNAGYLITGSNTFYNWQDGPSNSLIFPGWVTVGTNGGPAGTFPISPPVTNHNVLIGRYAFWVDIESAKLHLNTANRRDPLDVNRSAPGDVDLRGLDGNFFNADEADLDHFISRRPFLTVEDMRRGFTNYPLAWTWRDFDVNRFYLTVHSSDPNVDAFGRPRVWLNDMTNAASAAWTNALQQFSESHWADVIYPSVVTDAGRATVAGKYGNFGARQILANIIEYQLAHDPQRPAAGNVSPGPGLGADGIPVKWSGLKKGPMISQILVHVATNEVFASGNTTNLEVRAFFDAKLVNPYELARGSNYVVKILPDTITLTGTNAAPGGADFNITIAGTELSSTLQRDVQSHSFGLLGANSGSADLGAAPPPSVMQLVEGWEKTTGPVDQRAPGAPVVTNVSITLKTVRLLSSGGDTNIVDWMTASDFEAAFSALGGAMRFPRASFPQSEIVSYPAVTNNFDNAGSSHFRPVSLGKQDPRARTFPGWTAGSADFAGNGPNLVTNWFVYSHAQINPVGDDDASTNFTSRLAPELYGLLADTRCIAPGSPTAYPSHRYLINTIAEMPFQSAGELAHIHTGYPWRSVRLRPVRPQTTNAPPYALADPRLGPPYTGVGDPNTGLETVETNALPDWILLDMFTANPDPLVRGRLNLNGRFSGPASSLTARIPPLAALIYNTSSNISLTSSKIAGDAGVNTALDTIASNIANRVLVPNSPYASLPAYFTPGEICEVKHLEYFTDDTGASYRDYPSHARRQQLVRRVADLVTTRSDTFSIWAIGQSILDRDRDGRFDWVMYTLVVTPNYTNLWEDGDGDGDGRARGKSNIPEGIDFIKGQVIVQSVVQRHEPSPGTVGFRTRYVRYIFK
jgi:hypothetical protein